MPLSSQRPAAPRRPRRSARRSPHAAAVAKRERLPRVQPAAPLDWHDQVFCSETVTLADRVLDAPVDTGQARNAPAQLRARARLALDHAAASVVARARRRAASSRSSLVLNSRRISLDAPRPSTARSCLLEIIASHPPPPALTPRPRSCPYRPASWPLCFSESAWPVAARARLRFLHRSVGRVGRSRSFFLARSPRSRSCSLA